MRCYNSYVQKFIVIDPLLKDLLEASIVEGIDGLEEIHPGFYAYLKSEGFLVPEDEDEVQKIRDIVKVVDENTQSFLLTINPTMNCNFKCWYCYETHIKKSSFSDAMISKVDTSLVAVFPVDWSRFVGKLPVIPPFFSKVAISSVSAGVSVESMAA